MSDDFNLSAKRGALMNSTDFLMEKGMVYLYCGIKYSDIFYNEHWILNKTR